MNPQLLSAIRSVLGPMVSEGKCREVARAVLREIREPTPAMIEASGCSYDDYELHPNDVFSIWRIVVDHLLSTLEEGGGE